MLFKHLNFLKDQLFYTTFFVLFAAIFCYFQVLFLGRDFPYFWRQFHDVFLIFIFWRLTIVLILITIGIWWYQKKHRKNIVSKINANWILLASFINFLFFGCVLSQLLGGCIWFVFIEGWWDRFVPSFTTELVMIAFYALSSIVFYLFSFKLYEIYLENKGTFKKSEV